MVVISVSIPEEELQEFDSASKDAGFSSRSDAIRDAIRGFISTKKCIPDSGENISCIVTIIYSDKKKHHVHDIIHNYSDVVHSSMHTHVNGQCVEQIVLDGSSSEIKELFYHLSAQKDVRINLSIL
ncbi:CopG family ribbon-helix-helix protein [Candidatus Methanomassiliicoccus intestinalis]|uniref:CopG family transcriptional regulator n=1 Tax=Methanomassiliicoccus intestinalis (strain Issoire-Mx1) TaxID=1295009 RepID=R9TBK2_METII|nr:CopG family ribbon-helix-helix protein [Candidatus Methanomassiliicoccus intestinalis]AGN26818.1 CopG family transcriptional regulator [Candidatus Methanomassiliicoccus intestinalis Issoire-Mx1]